MSRLSGILKIIFVILVLITVGEIGYYLYFQFSNKSNLSPAVTAEPTPISLANLIPNSNSLPNIQITPNQNPALNQSSIVSLTYAQKGVLESSKVTNIYRGVIAELDTKGGVTAIYKFKYKIKIKIRGRQNSLQSFYFNEENMDKIEFVDVSKGKEIPTNYYELKVGDNIILEDTRDLFKNWDSNIVGVKVTKV